MAGLTPDGVLVVDKPVGPTSHDIVAQARRAFGTRSVGHAGTLDPMASGVLVLMFGEAKKLSSYLTAESKRYTAEITFGRSTDSLDATGAAVSEVALPEGWCSPAAFEQALAYERKRTWQMPPAFSAIKVSGRPAHRRVRSGEQPELRERPVVVHALELLELGADRATVELFVSKGYYVRALARDLGERLGVPAHLSRLRRTSSGPWTLEQAVALPLTGSMPLHPTAEAASRCLGVHTLTETGARRAVQGLPLRDSDFVAVPAADDLEVHAWLDTHGTLLALGQAVCPGEYRVVRGFRQSPVSGP